MGDDQVFVSGRDLKADLAKLDAHYWALPADVKERGVMSFAHYPPAVTEVISTPPLGFW